MPHRSVFRYKCRVLIARQPQPTVEAMMPPIVKLFWHHTTTPGILLTRAVWIHCNRQQPSSCSLDRQDLQELPPSSIVNRLCKSCPGQTFDVQRLMRYVPPFSQQPVGYFVVKIPALICYFQMRLS